MTTIVKHEWHSVDSQFALEVDESILSEIYPDLSEEEIAQKLAELESGELDIDTLVEDAQENDVELEWQHQYDDNWTSRKGGYKITYELGDADSWHSEPEKVITHKCIKCKWAGGKYDSEWLWEKDGVSLDEALHVCPMCESLVELTPEGVAEKAESDERSARWAKEAADAEEAVECFSCGVEHKESDLVEMSSQYHCPSCGEGWVMPDDRPVSESNLEAALEELKSEFELLSADMANEAEPEPTEQLVFPAGEYTIKIWGRTLEYGVAEIKQEQYEYWSDDDNEDDLSEALNGGYDYEDHDADESLVGLREYYDYKTKLDYYGYEVEGCKFVIENSDGEVIFDGDYEGLLEFANGDDWYDKSEETGELYAENAGGGYWMWYKQGGKGACLETSINTGSEPLDLKKFSLKTTDVDGTSHFNTVTYAGVDNDDYGMNDEDNNWRGQWSDFGVVHNDE